MGQFDQAARYTAKLDPPAFLRWLLPGLDPALTFQGWLDTRTLPFPGEPDRTCVPWLTCSTRLIWDAFGR